MATLDRIPIQRAGRVQLPKSELHTLSGVKVYEVRGIDEPVLHLEFIVDAGRIHAAHPSHPSVTASMMNEGTESRSARDIAEQIEYFGSTIRCNAGTDALSISLYCVDRFFEQSLEIVEDLMMNATFPQSELEIYKQNREQRLEISLQRNEYIANTAITSQIFANHVYGYHVTKEDILNLDRVSLLNHYAAVGSSNLSAFICGNITNEHLACLEQMLGRIRPGTKTPGMKGPEPSRPIVNTIDGPQHMQCSIRMGRQIISRNHDEFGGLYFLNTLFGGYFGSRLMTNIREDKGLTYNISSSLETLAGGASLILNTEASSENKDLVLSEIRKEMESLCETTIDDSECEMVRNYLMGSLMMQLDGPFRAMDVIKTLHMECVGPESFDKMLDTIESIGPAELRELARKYLSWDTYHVVSVI